MKNLTDKLHEELESFLSSKEKTFISLSNEFLKSNKRIDRDRCLLVKGKIEMLKELLGINANNSFIQVLKKKE